MKALSLAAGTNAERSDCGVFFFSFFSACQPLVGGVLGVKT